MRRDSFQVVFESNYDFLCRYAERIVKDSSVSEDIVINVFLNLWKLYSSLDEKTNIQAYLFRSVNNSCINYLKSKYKRTEVPVSWSICEEDLTLKVLLPKLSNPLEHIIEKERLAEINEAIRRLPPKTRDVFMKSRYEEKTYAQISVEMGISINTVKYHMKSALSYLAEEVFRGKTQIDK